MIQRATVSAVVQRRATRALRRGDPTAPSITTEPNQTKRNEPEGILQHPDGVQHERKQTLGAGRMFTALRADTVEAFGETAFFFKGSGLRRNLAVQ